MCLGVEACLTQSRFEAVADQFVVFYEDYAIVDSIECLIA
jgi:hypothetical protein